MLEIMMVYMCATTAYLLYRVLTLSKRIDELKDRLYNKSRNHTEAIHLSLIKNDMIDEAERLNLFNCHDERISKLERYMRLDLKDKMHIKGALEEELVRCQKEGIIDA